MKNYDASQSDAISCSALTNKQRQFLVGQKFYDSLPIYNLCFTYTIQGELKVQHFQNTFQALINSCDVFRTIIEDIDGVPRLKVLPHFPYTMEFCDFSQHPDPEYAAQAWIQSHMQKVFKLNECLFESALIRLAEAKWIWFYKVHHIISDGISISLMYHRMSELYGRALVGAPEEQMAQPQYHGYVEWEADFFKTDRHQKGKEFWAAKLRQPSEPLQLYGRTMDSQLVPINRVTYPLDDKITKDIYRLASSRFASGPSKPAAIFEIFAAVFMTYLYRIGGQQHLSMGVPFHNRPAGPFKKTVGLFVEVAPLFIDIADTETFETLRKKIRRELQVMSRHVRSVPEHTLQDRPYHVMLNYHLYAFPDFCGMPTFTQWHHTGMGNVGLNINIQDFNSSGNFTLEFDINAELFDEKQQHRMFQHTLRLFQAFLKDPSQRLNTVSMLSDEEVNLVVHKFNQPPNRISLKQTNGVLLPTSHCVHHLIEAQVGQTPEAVAVVFESEKLTYQKLDTRANQMAHYLQRYGIGPESRVGLCLDRSIEMIVAVLGIFKAGGAYVPLDPNYPQERLAFFAKDADLHVILTQEKFQEHLSPLGVEQILLDADWPVIAQEEASTPASEARADSLAYVLYTSGS
ncbi:MAG: condensation domain-containing protein, partial [Deltaproteobacteria bacterium]|nr:condensation domain-containing protein [Deltaproteobacteria bacterium]